MTSPKKIDLHTHSTVSDGTDPPGEPVRVKLTWFEPDGLKLGGAYRSETVTLRRVDRGYRLLELSDHSLIEIDRVLDVREVTE